MSEKVDQLVKRAMQLPHDERADLRDALQIAIARQERCLPVDKLWIDSFVRELEERRRPK